MTTITVRKLTPEEPALPLGERLIAAGLISRDQLHVALKEQSRRDEPLGRILVKLGLISEGMLRDTLGESLGHDSIDLSTVIPDPDALQMVPKNIARRYSMLPINFDKNEKVLTLAMADTFNVVAMDQIAALLGAGVGIATLVAGEAEIEAAIEQFYKFELSIQGILHEIDTGEVDQLNRAVENEEYNHPLIRLVDAILADAVKRDTSDIHLEPEEGFLRVRYRIDGVLRQVMALHRSYWPGMVVRLKVMAKMNIAETRAPQDGRISLTLAGRPIDFRVACQQTTHGENFVLRVLDRQKGIVPLEKLNLEKNTLMSLQVMMARPEGIILVTGPTGSGKTTTLYSMLNWRNDEAVNIMTLEDPVEYPMNMIRQTSLNEAAKLDFANGIRSMMRQDPDVILVGEIRDEETAEMAFRAAMTGHQVFSTLHTNSALGAIPRLIDIGVKPQIMAGNIIGIVAQRLVRRLCRHCKQAHAPDETERRLLGISSNKPILLYKEQGCDACNFMGYKGRLAVIEVLKMNEGMDEMIARDATRREMHEAAVKAGFKDLAEDAVRHVLNGMTSLSEISRVVDLTARVG
ncbi:MAG: GspE/PulE family protein [Gammaproteobacteria bacterium]|nr:GspE/PulE family protein [Gammaproteobacteria bacterium]MDH3429849.1 GspE/PulE family protein [Gammaproteobacteria bacterium]MDH3434851.1 GspE/PulE family protein [Gammaproteobacteria bacterium]